MQIMDETADAVLATGATEATSAFARFRGLMLKPRLSPGAALVLRPCGSIHMMFMRFSIDAVFFDRDLRVTRVARGVRPWIGVAFGGRGAAGVIELPRGTAANTATGNQLRFDRTG